MSALEDARSRIHSMTLMYDRLYQSNDPLKIDFSGYVYTLTNDFLRIYAVESKNITIDTHVEEIPVSIKKTQCRLDLLLMNLYQMP